jgi:thiol-disulfide isomerase/thioredoxin
VSVKARRDDEAAALTRRFLLILGGAVAAVLVVVLAVAVGNSADDGGDVVYPTAAVYGDPLQPAGADPLGSGDPAMGATAPIIEGYDLDGNIVRIGPDGEPTIVVLLAHWCPHCQREVPILVDWLAGFAPGEAPKVVAVATSIDPTRPNHPPEAWLEREQWPTEVLYDADGEAAIALGLSGFPFFVVLDGEGTVVRRLSGEIEMRVLEEILAGF